MDIVKHENNNNEKLKKISYLREVINDQDQANPQFSLPDPYKRRIKYDRAFLLDCKDFALSLAPPNIPQEIFGTPRAVSPSTLSPTRRKQEVLRRSYNNIDMNDRRSNEINDRRHYNETYDRDRRQNYGENYERRNYNDNRDHDRRNFHENNYDRRSYTENRRNHHDRYRNSRGEEQEPEWFSEGPMTYNDTIELTGFHDDHRQEKNKYGK